jgi:hypothetical protein
MGNTVGNLKKCMIFAGALCVVIGHRALAQNNTEACTGMLVWVDVKSKGVIEAPKFAQQGRPKRSSQQWWLRLRFYARVS